MTSTAPLPNVLFVGDPRHAEFREALAWLSSKTQVTLTPDIQAAHRHIATYPLLIVLAEARRGQFAHRDVARLQRRFPLARLVSLLGSWCEGESRSGSPIPVAVRTYWHQFIPRIGADLARVARGECPTWGRPLTETAEESLRDSQFATVASSSATIAVVSACSMTREGICELLAMHGHRPLAAEQFALSHHPPVRCDLVVWDDSLPPRHQRIGWQQVQESFADKSIIGLVNFLRFDDPHRQLAAALAKPYSANDLLQHIDVLVSAMVKRHQSAA